MTSVGSSLTFNVHDGFLEALVRGYRSGILSQSDYASLTQCETLEDMRLHLATTDYGNFLDNELSPLHTTTIAEKCTEKLVKEFNFFFEKSSRRTTVKIYGLHYISIYDR